MSEPAREQRTVTDPRVMRALAHPARLALVEHLSSSEAPSTATELAQVTGLSPSATSYHLRELAKAGLVSQAPSRGDGRERLWQNLSSGYRLEGEKPDSAESRSAERALLAVILEREDRRVRDWMRQASDEPPEWHAATAITTAILDVTAEELTSLTRSVEEMVAPYRRRDRTDPPAGSRLVAVQWRAVPEVGLPGEV